MTKEYVRRQPKSNETNILSRILQKNDGNHIISVKNLGFEHTGKKTFVLTAEILQMYV